MTEPRLFPATTFDVKHCFDMRTLAIWLVGWLVLLGGYLGLLDPTHHALVLACGSKGSRLRSATVLPYTCDRRVWSNGGNGKRQEKTEPVYSTTANSNVATEKLQSRSL